MMETSESWRGLFENWPDAIPRTGNLVTTYGDTIPFCGFMVSGGLLLLERSRPDPIGNRKVMLPYETVAAVNSTSGAEMSQFQCMGFRATV